MTSSILCKGFIGGVTSAQMVRTVTILFFHKVINGAHSSMIQHKHMNDHNDLPHTGGRTSRGMRFFLILLYMDVVSGKTAKGGILLRQLLFGDGNQCKGS
jgi:hypothetical protein